MVDEALPKFPMIELAEHEVRSPRDGDTMASLLKEAKECVQEFESVRDSIEQKTENSVKTVSYVCRPIHESQTCAFRVDEHVSEVPVSELVSSWSEEAKHLDPILDVFNLKVIIIIVLTFCLLEPARFRFLGLTA